MALPVNWQLGHIEGRWINFEGEPESGTVTLIPNVTRVTNASEEVIIVPSQLTYTLDVSGAIDETPPASIDADNNPAAFNYTVVENLSSGMGRTYPLDVTAVGTTFLYAVVATEPTEALGPYVASLDQVPDSASRLAMTAAERTKLGSGFAAAVEAVIPVAPTSEVAYAQITADLAGMTIDALNIDLVTGLAVTIPSIARPVYVFANVTVHHSVANAVIQPLLCKTSPAPATILDALGIGFLPLTTAGAKGQAFVMARIPASTPCTVQFYLSGTAGTATVTAQSYYPSKIWAVSM